MMLILKKMLIRRGDAGSDEDVTAGGDECSREREGKTQSCSAVLVEWTSRVRHQLVTARKVVLVGVSQDVDQQKQSFSDLKR
jgi:hypothetical protein